ncbi:MAG: superinfection immunity protein [Myxococcota bacterium]
MELISAGLFLVLLILWIPFVLLPIMIAFSRRHPNRVPILIVSIFLGWTLIGWVVALAWSLTAIPESARPVERPLTIEEKEARLRARLKGVAAFVAVVVALVGLNAVTKCSREGRGQRAATSGPPPPPTTLRVAVPAAVLRESASAESGRIASLPRGCTVRRMKSNDGWTFVALKPSCKELASSEKVYGWVASRLLEPTRDSSLPLTRVAAEAAHIRKYPSMSGVVAGRVPRGCRLRVLGERETWTHVELADGCDSIGPIDGSEGWIATRLLEPSR